MRAIVVPHPGGPETLAVMDVPSPRPGPGEVLVNVAAAGVNYLDIYHRTGHYVKPTPFTPGIEGTGTVLALGAGVSSLSVGDRVAWVYSHSSYAEQAVVLARQAVRVPDAIPDRLAAAGLLHGLSARYLTSMTYPVGPADTVLVQGGGGGARRLVVQLAKARGARVIATVPGPRQAEYAASAGADLVLDYTEQDIAREVRRFTDGIGADVVYDGVGRITFDSSLASLRTRGTLALMSELSGPIAPLDPARLTAGSFMFTRPVLPHFIDGHDQLEAGAQDVFAWIRNGTLDVRLGKTYSLDEAAAAHKILETKTDTGKPVIAPYA